MKKRLNITIREDLIEKMKKYADHQEKSISNIVEEHFEELLTAQSILPNKISLVDFVQTLPKSKIMYPEYFDFQKEYYKAKAKDYDEQNPV